MQLEPKDLYEKLEFDKVLALLKEYCLGEQGKEAAEKIALEVEPFLIERKLKEVDEFKLTFDNNDGFPIATYKEITKELRMLEVVDYLVGLEQQAQQGQN